MYHRQDMPRKFLATNLRIGWPESARSSIMLFFTRPEGGDLFE